MKQMISSDLYKLRKAKYFWICLAITVALSVAVIVLQDYVFMETMYAKDFLLELFASDLPLLLIAIATALFVGSEFNNGTIKNIASTNISRNIIYASKTIVSIIMGIIYTVAGAAAAFITALYFWGFGKVEAGYWLPTLGGIGLELLLISAFVSLFVMFSFLIRQNGGSLAVNICFLQFFAMFVELGQLALHRFFNVEANLIDYLLNYNMRYVAEGLTQQTAIRALCVGVGFILVSYVLGSLSFKRRDIK